MISNLAYISQDTSHLGGHTNGLQIGETRPCYAHPSGALVFERARLTENTQIVLEFSGSSCTESEGKASGKHSSEATPTLTQVESSLVSGPRGRLWGEAEKPVILSGSRPHLPGFHAEFFYVVICKISYLLPVVISVTHIISPSGWRLNFIRNTQKS